MVYRKLIIGLALLSTLNGFAEKGNRGGNAGGSFELGKRHYESGQYARALDLFSQSINAASDGASRNRAYYYQGMVLFEMGHYYSAYISFRNVLLSADDNNREVYEKAIKNAVIITDRLNMVDRLGKILEKLPSSYIPSSVGDFANYSIGIFNFKSGNDDAAASHLKSVHPESPFYYKAMFHLGILSTKKKDYKEAVFYFEKVGQVLRGKREGFSQAELSRLNLARSLYSSGSTGSRRSFDGFALRVTPGGGASP